MYRADRQFLLTTIFVVCTLIVTFATMLVSADDFYVSTGGSDSNTGTSAVDAWRTISYAIDTVPTDGTWANPHIIHVAPGTYTYTTGGSDDEDFPISWSERQLQHVWLIGDDRDSTIVSYGNWASSGEEELGLFEVIGFAQYLNDVTISTLTIRDGRSDDDGAGIYTAAADVTVDNCVVEACRTVTRGGGIKVGSPNYPGGDVDITSCIIGNENQENQANYGGGIAADNDTTVNIVDCLIQHNETFFGDGQGCHGGGIFMEDAGGLIKDCYILGNIASPDDSGYGGGIYLKNSSPHIEHNQIRATLANYHYGPGNHAYAGGGIYMTGNSDPLIDGWNEIAENWADTSGGGMYINGVGCEPVIEGNELFWNQAAGLNGGAIFGYKSKASVENNWIGWNYADQAGGGIYCEEDYAAGSGHAVFAINWIHHNDAGDEGGGAYFKNGYKSGDTGSTFDNNNLWANTANRGGGLCLTNSSNFTVQDNGIWDNDATDRGDGILVNGGSVTLFNNLIFSSNGNDDQGVGIEVVGNADLTIRNLTIADHPDCGIKGVLGNVWIWDTIIWGNGTSVTPGGATFELFYCDIQGGWSGTGSDNMNEEPLFVPLAGARGYPEGYFLSQTAAGQSPPDSPCVDAGSTTAAAYFTNEYCTRTDAENDTGDMDMGYHYLHEGATYIELVSFNAKGLNKRVLLSWTTATEIDNAGFDIYRKEEGGASLVKVNSSLISGRGTAGGGASYSFVDTGVVSGTTYLYYLCDIDTKGNVTSHEPVSATPYSLDLPSLQGDGEPHSDLAPIKIGTAR
ncbi:MAG TPA: right-handed parallel beta-helix repeat-containing protein [bacterium]|nr:right-handed parallel beta-helix repeat-containing protein [bacterium]